jgi:hypothetical protein
MSTVTHTRQPDGSWLVQGLQECLYHGEHREDYCPGCVAGLAETNRTTGSIIIPTTNRTFHAALIRQQEA